MYGTRMHRMTAACSESGTDPMNNPCTIIIRAVLVETTTPCSALIQTLENLVWLLLSTVLMEMFN